MNLRGLAELLRVPAALSVPGDVIAGATAAGAARSRRTGGLVAASVCLYWAGMAANDWADRDLDAVERPERPIPSGRVSPRQALGVAVGLTAAGVGLAGLAGGRPAAVTAAALAGTVWAYDTVLKDTAAGPVAMAAARGLDVLLGASASGRTRAGLVPAGLLAAHTAGVTLLSRGEVHGTRPVTASLAGGVTVLTAAAAAGHGRAVLPVALAATYARSVGSAQLAAVSSPDAGTVRRATGAGIRGMIPLQAALVARRSPLAAVALLAAGPIVKAASKVVSPT